MMDQRVEMCQQFQLFFANQTSSFQHFFKCRASDFYLCDLLVELPYFQTEKRKCRFVYDEELNRSEVFTNAFYVLELMDETYPQNVHNFEELSLETTVKIYGEAITQNVKAIILGDIQKIDKIKIDEVKYKVISQNDALSDGKFNTAALEQALNKLGECNDINPGSFLLPGTSTGTISSLK